MYPVAEYRTWHDLTIPTNQEQYITAMGGLGRLQATLSILIATKPTTPTTTAAIARYRKSLGNWFDTLRIIAHDTSTTLRNRENPLKAQRAMTEYHKTVCEAGAALVKTVLRIALQQRQPHHQRRKINTKEDRLPPLAPAVRNYFKVKDTLSTVTRRSSEERNCIAEVEKFKNKPPARHRVTRNLALLELLKEASLCSIAESVENISEMLQDYEGPERIKIRSALVDEFAIIEREAAVSTITMLGPKAASSLRKGVSGGTNQFEAMASVLCKPSGN